MSGLDIANSETALLNVASLWLHGAGLAGATWRAQTSDLPRAIAPDLPGHGCAAAISPPTVERYADRLLPLLKDDMVVIGHSLGGMVALEMLAQSRARPKALVLVECVPTVTDRWIGRTGPRLARPLLRYLPRRLLDFIGGVGQSPRAAREARHWLAAMSRDRLVEVFDAARLYDGRRHLSGIRVPTLVLVGSDNRATHRGARMMADQIAGAEFETLQGGHMLHIDNPSGLRRSISTFLSRIPHRSRSIDTLNN